MIAVKCEMNKYLQMQNQTAITLAMESTFVERRDWLLESKFYAFLRKVTHTRYIALIFMILSALSIILTYLAITKSENPFGPNLRKIMGLIVIDLVFLLAFAGVISKRLVDLVIERRKGYAGSGLQTRIVVMFSIVAIIPSVVMAVFSLVFFNYGIQSWFDKKVSTAIEESVQVARLYLEEHKKIIGADIMGMANDLNRDAYNVRRNPETLNNKLTILAGIRKLPEAIVFQRGMLGKKILAHTPLSMSLGMILEGVSEKVFDEIDKGDLVILTNDPDDRVMAIVRLENYFDTYLAVGSYVDEKIINHIETTEGAANEYSKLKSSMALLQVKFFIVFVIVSLLLLSAIVWRGLIFAVELVKPVGGLIEATEKVKEGNFKVRVAEGDDDDELATLGRAFNRMTEQLEFQRAELVSAQRRSAWADVARRIAHEIKNPLTPIQLATDRLRRKYQDDVKDKELFLKYVDTISRNINSIGHMVEEFVSFARIPAPVFSNNDIGNLIWEVIFSREGSNPYINFEYTPPQAPIIINCDAGQISRIMINLLKNAEESIDEKLSSNKDFGKGVIKVNLKADKEECHIEIKDNGKGFDKNILDRVTEPYVTSKSKGTGLGLAIVKKIVEDHNGEIKFANIKGEACVSLIFPLEPRVS